tara:strand:- start:64 stop:636 length:573 start_codon:yes stop_codon:yes gene_type:complete
MANPNAPFGFNPVGKIGSGPSQKLNQYKIASAYNTLICQGDAVLPATGNIAAGTAAADLVGVFWGVNYNETSTNKPIFKNQWPASTATFGSVSADAFVYDDPYQVFEIQGTTGTLSAQADIMISNDIVATAGDTTTGTSNQTLKMTSPAAAGAAQLTTIGFSGNDSRNQIDSAGCAVYNVIIAEHVYSNL